MIASICPVFQDEQVTLAMNRTLDASSAVSVNALVFSGGEIWSEDEPDAQANVVLQSLAQSVAAPSSAEINETSQSAADQNVSTYVRVFESEPYHSLFCALDSSPLRYDRYRDQGGETLAQRRGTRAPDRFRPSFLYVTLSTTLHILAYPRKITLDSSWSSYC